MKKIVDKMVSILLVAMLILSFNSCVVFGRENYTESEGKNGVAKFDSNSSKANTSQYDKGDTTKNGLNTSNKTPDEKITDSKNKTEIGNGPWYDSNGLEYEYISAEEMSVFSIEEPCFAVKGLGTCTSPNITIPKTFQGLPVLVVGGFAFRDCTSIQNVILPEGLIVIAGGAFRDCKTLKSIVIPSTLKQVDVRAFDGCDGLIEVFYMGTSAKWETIDMTHVNYNLNLARRYYYSATEPDRIPHVLNYNWCYVNGVPTPWEELFS